MAPLCLTVHFTSIPEDHFTIGPIKADSEASSAMCHQLKQSHALQYSSTKEVNNLTGSQWQDYVSSVKECNYTKFSGIRGQLKKEEKEGSQKAVMVHYNEAIWLRAAPFSSTTEGSMTLSEFFDSILPSDVVLRYNASTSSQTDVERETLKMEQKQEHKDPVTQTSQTPPEVVQESNNAGPPQNEESQEGEKESNQQEQEQQQEQQPESEATTFSIITTYSKCFVFNPRSRPPT